MGKSSTSDAFNGGSQPVERIASRLPSEDGALIGERRIGDGAGADARGIPERVARGQIPAATMVRVGSHVVSYPREIEKYGQLLRALAKVMAQLRQARQGQGQVSRRTTMAEYPTPRWPSWRPTRKERERTREQLSLRVEAGFRRRDEAVAATRRVLRLLWDAPDAIPRVTTLLEQRGARMDRPFEAVLATALTRQLVSEDEIVCAAQETA